MSSICAEIHRLFNQLPRHTFPFDIESIPKNGIYILFEKGETGHGVDRIVRVGTHNGKNQLRPRLKQHYFNSNKDRSIFRKNIGRSLLNKRKDPFLEYWNKDLTTRKAKEQYAGIIDFQYQARIEDQVSQYIREYFSFVVFEVEEKKDRLDFESKIISTVSWCDECQSSEKWLGKSSPKEKIVESGLWLVNQLYKEPLRNSDYRKLELVNASSV